MLIVTNNKMIAAEYAMYDVMFLDSSGFLEVLERCRDKIHLGHKLLTHPLSSSLKPNETPFKTVILSGRAGHIDFQSLQIIEDSIATTRKFLQDGLRQWPERVLDDFRLIDFSLFSPEALGQYEAY